jgi:hypothetical protein
MYLLDEYGHVFVSTQKWTFHEGFLTQDRYNKTNRECTAYSNVQNICHRAFTCDRRLLGQKFHNIKNRS